MTNYTVKPSERRERWNDFPGAEFEVMLAPATEPVTLLFKRQGNSREFELTGVQSATGDRFVLNGVCNYTPCIEEMKRLGNDTVERQQIEDRIEEARELLSKAQSDLKKLRRS